MGRLFLVLTLIVALTCPVVGYSTGDALAAKSIDKETAESLAKSIADKVGGTDVIDTAAELIGATEGASFKLDGKKFEIYKFTDKAKLEEAKSGKMKISIPLFGDFVINTVVNGSFVLMFETENSKVTNEFK